MVKLRPTLVMAVAAACGFLLAATVAAVASTNESVSPRDNCGGFNGHVVWSGQLVPTSSSTARSGRTSARAARPCGCRGTALPITTSMRKPLPSLRRRGSTTRPARPWGRGHQSRCVQHQWRMALRRSSRRVAQRARAADGDDHHPGTSGHRAGDGPGAAARPAAAGAADETNDELDLGPGDHAAAQGEGRQLPSPNPCAGALPRP